jgi:hypothetical protein
MAAPVEPTEVFRFASACAGTACKHFHQSNCRLAKRIVQILPPAERIPPSCAIRPTCRWFQQEGALACIRCSQVVTLTFNPDERLMRVAAGEQHAQNEGEHP